MIYVDGASSEIVMSREDTRVTSFGKPGANRSHRGGAALKQRCPHCNEIAVARTTREVTPLFKEMRFQCTNVESERPCGHTFVASLVIERTIVPSACPNPRIQLPIAPPRKRAEV